MTPDERSLLFSFLRDLSAARGMAKDAEADGMIRDALAANPDAAYALVQHAIVADQSLHAAQARIAQLEDATRAASSAAGVPSTRFLPQSGTPWGAPNNDTSYAPPPVEQRPGIFSGGGGLGSFLRSAGTTAAGVAGGEMLFNGLSGLFGGHGGGGGGFLGGGQGFMGGSEENVVINNYNDDGGYDDGGNGNW
ncbi:DUF2076 domain-containing protein [uncultured Sphingomonas sp.]|uniref:DUF2076 domain-containing protein n=1 Tax=uncultured Sphingomonas sp. TaxID=158754 RepID=UPI0035CC3D68